MHDFSPVWTGILQAPGENMFVAIHVKENLVASRHIDQEWFEKPVHPFKKRKKEVFLLKFSFVVF